MSLIHTQINSLPCRLPFLTKLRLANIVVESFGKEVFRYLLGGCEDIERLYLSFADTAYFFSGKSRTWSQKTRKLMYVTVTSYLKLQDRGFATSVCRLSNRRHSTN